MAELSEVEATGDKNLDKVTTVEIEGPVELEHKPRPSEPATTAEEDRHTKSARNINMIWETTQAAIAIAVVGANIASLFFVAATASTSSSEMMRYAFFLVIGFYFGRTNHARSGGVAAKESR